VVNNISLVFIVKARLFPALPGVVAIRVRVVPVALARNEFVEELTSNARAVAILVALSVIRFRCVITSVPARVKTVVFPKVGVPLNATVPSAY
jgi:hypothetical protein